MDPVVVTLPHRQGKAEATRRIKAGIEALRARYTAQLTTAAAPRAAVMMPAIPAIMKLLERAQ